MIVACDINAIKYPMYRVSVCCHSSALLLYLFRKTLGWGVDICNLWMRLFASINKLCTCMCTDAMFIQRLVCEFCKCMYRLHRPVSLPIKLMWMGLAWHHSYKAHIIDIPASIKIGFIKSSVNWMTDGNPNELVHVIIELCYCSDWYMDG